MCRTACTEPQCLYSRSIPLLPLCAVRLVQSLSACTVYLYLYSPYGPYGLYSLSACTVQLYLYSPYGPYDLYSLSACTVQLYLYSPYGPYDLYSLSACTIQLYLYSPYGPYGLYSLSACTRVHFTLILHLYIPNQFLPILRLSSLKVYFLDAQIVCSKPHNINSTPRLLRYFSRLHCKWPTRQRRKDITYIRHTSISYLDSLWAHSVLFCELDGFKNLIKYTSCIFFCTVQCSTGWSKILWAPVSARGSTVVKVLCYKSEGRWFDSRWCHWNYSLI